MPTISVLPRSTGQLFTCIPVGLRFWNAHVLLPSDRVRSIS